jgi:hypothetical protein
MNRKLSDTLRSTGNAGGIRAILRTDSTAVRLVLFLLMSAVFYLFVETTDRQSGLTPILGRDTSETTRGQADTTKK